VILENAASFYHKIFKCDTPAKELQCLLLSTYILTGKAESGTLLERVIKARQNPLNLNFIKPKSATEHREDGLVDSLKHLLHHENYQKPWSQEHILATLLTKAF